MKFLGLVKDPKDITTKEYVDSADEAIKESTKAAIDTLNKNKVSATDIAEYSPVEVQTLWARAFSSK